MTAAPTLTDRLLAGDTRALARAISLVENETDDGARLVGKIYAKTGHAYLIGVTGPPGAGKSTLVDRIIATLRARGQKVAVLCVDPTSPYSGGAILGDRVRMQSHASDDGVYIRSMATRGHLGGLATTTAEAALVLDAAGFDVIIIETVGVGQDEVDIVRTADVSLVVLVPGTGDEVQALKAGIMEIADIFVVNKADREGADRTAASIESMLTLEMFDQGEWKPPVLRTEATSGRGVTELLDMVEAFRAHSGARVGARRRARAEWRLREMLGRRFLQHLEQDVLAPGEFDRTLDRIAGREIDPYTAVTALMAKTAALDHVGIAVEDATAMRALFGHHFGLATGEPEVVGLHRLQFVETGETTLELVEPVSADAPIAKFIAKKGAGLHHICLRVADIDRAMADLTAKGVQFIDAAPRQGAHGSRIAFIHPSSACGLLVEIKQPAGSHEGSDPVRRSLGEGGH
jgi:LAO/AO transport system kinase